MKTKHIGAILAITFVVLWLIHFIMVVHFSINVPFYDEVDMFDPNASSKSFSLGWLFAFHNEHRIVTTKLLIWFLYLVSKWNLVLHQTINFIIFSGFVFWTFLFLKKHSSFKQNDLKKIFGLSFCVFLLSPINHENHSWAFQTQFHLSLLFFFLSTTLLFESTHSSRNLWAGVVCLILSMYSFSFGILMSIILLVNFLYYKLLVQKKINAQEGCAVSVSVFSVFFWFYGYVTPSHHPHAVGPLATKFWNFFANLVAYGFGFEEMSLYTGYFCLALLISIIMMFIFAKRTKDQQFWILLTLVLGLCGALSTIAVGRAGFGLQQSKVSRYVEVSMFLVPVLALMLDRVFQKKLKLYVLCGLWMLCFFGYLNNWRFPVYKNYYWQKQNALTCIKNYYEQTRLFPNKRAQAICTNYSGDIWEKLDAAKRLKISFTED